MALASELRGILTGLSLVAAALLAAVSIDLGIPGQELLQSLRFHLVIACLLLPVGLALCGARLRATVVLGLLLLSAAQGALVLAGQFQHREPPPAVIGALSFMSFNILNENPRPDAVVDYLVDQAPQVAVLMEANAIAGRLDTLRTSFPGIIGCNGRYDCDTAIFTSLPVLESQVYELGSFRRHRLITAKLDFHGQAVTIVAVHLSKPYFDQASVEELGQLARTLGRQEGPLILAGDFNSAPWSTSFAAVLAGAGMAPPPSLPATWPTELGPLGIPIDNIYSRDGAFIRDIAAFPDPLGSNHLGLHASIDIGTATTPP